MALIGKSVNPTQLRKAATTKVPAKSSVEKKEKPGTKENPMKAQSEELQATVGNKDYANKTIYAEKKDGTKVKITYDSDGYPQSIESA